MSDLAKVICCRCATTFAMERKLAELRLSDGGTFWCPVGHAQRFVESLQSKLTKAQTEALQAKSKAEQLEAKLTEKKGWFGG